MKYVVLMFGGPYLRDALLSPIRIHDIYLEYEVGGLVDSTSPVLEPAPDIEYIFGQTGNKIVWNCSDAHPDRFWMLGLQLWALSTHTNPDFRTEGLWNGSSFIVPVDGLVVGTHEYELWITDKGGFMVWDFVWVIVIEHPIISFIRLNPVIIGIAALVVIVFFYKLRNK